MFGSGDDTMIVDSSIDYRFQSDEYTLKLIARAFVTYAEANVQYLTSLRNEQIIENIEVQSLLDEAIREHEMYREALEDGRLMRPILTQDLYASDHILRGMGAFHERTLRIRADYRIEIEDCNGLHHYIDRDNSDYATIREIYTAANNADDKPLFMNNHVYNHRGRHFDLGYHPRLPNMVPSSDALPPDFSSHVVSDQAAQAVHPGRMSTSEDMVSMILSIEIILKNLTTSYSPPCLLFFILIPMILAI